MGQIIKFNSKINIYKWMIYMIDNYPGQLFDGNSENYIKFWNEYVNIENNQLPNEMEFPYKEQYYIESINEDYTLWYKNNYKIFCKKIKKVRNVLYEIIYKKEG